jgi:hypothetical protein
MSRSRYDECPEVCGRLDEPGLALDMPRWIDHTELDTTVDQARIEAVLERLSLGPDVQILHVGVGNSRFAQRFAPRVGWIDGLTVCDPERRLADSLAIPNYRVYLLSKYSREFLTTIRRSFDYVVDNNLASFACCKYHFYRMLDNYLWCLRPAGRVLTDQRGMDWTVEDDPRWQLTYDDLLALGERFRIEVSALSDTVYAIGHRRGGAGTA